MSLNDTPSGERVNIAFFGLRNAGKSSLVNSVTGQDLAVVSDVKGTTTDPVKKAMELLPLGPVVIIDTPGLDDEGELGELRVKKAKQVLGMCDVAVLVTDSRNDLTKTELDLIHSFEERNLKFVIARNKSDLLAKIPDNDSRNIYVSALTGANVNLLKDRLASLAKNSGQEKFLVRDLLSAGDFVILVIPIDKAAPKGRLILPQQQTIRDILDARCSCLLCQDTELEKIFGLLTVKPKLVITDSQVFEKVSEIVPEDILLTSFSILFARYKGDLRVLVNGAKKLENLRDGDRVLISEGCTHHRQCGDIGTEKMPSWIRKFSGANPEFAFTSGGDFPDENDLRKYALIVHCGGCMLNEQEMRTRLERASRAGVSIVNYGIAIANMHGILKRSLEPFKNF